MSCSCQERLSVIQLLYSLYQDVFDSELENFSFCIIWQKVLIFCPHFHLELLYSSYFYVCYPGCSTDNIALKFLLLKTTPKSSASSGTLRLNHAKQDGRSTAIVHHYWQVFSLLNSPCPFCRVQVFSRTHPFTDLEISSP